MEKNDSIMETEVRKMKKYCMIETGYRENHAGPKARVDVGEILKRAGWETVEVHQSRKGGIRDKLKMAFVTVSDWQRVLRRIPRGACLLIQYPLATYHMVNVLALPFLGRLHKKAKILMLIHDLDSIRFPKYQKRLQKIEKDFFRRADVLIAHNPQMRRYLEDCGFQGKIEELGVFDYLADRKNTEPKPVPPGVILIAGSMDRGKAGYVYRLGEIAKELRYELYGPSYTPDTDAEHIEYKGEKKPEQLPDILNGQYGLVWDGPSVDTCLGGFGAYLKYNNPHKVSLYLACGIPVIIWKEAALAEFVQKNKVGITVASLRELESAVKSVSEEEYKEMRRKAGEIGAEIRKGSYTLTAVERCLNEI